ncbi:MULTISPECIES: integration host factor subunit alpha [unclassified Novosphingobium]|uniref:integration host factor subunit alpha n=1 Tax=unclassified Novosphingobium TaxID=2644732 RepID=UPI001F274E2C|nr:MULTISPECIES: integration host factor subunit alpha [unclassified Novosphingobium]
MSATADTLTKAGIAEALRRDTALSHIASLAIVDAIIEHMRAALGNGESVKIAGFGTFLLRDKNERIGRNPKTGVEVPIAQRRVTTFRASGMLKDKVAGNQLSSGSL